MAVIIVEILLASLLGSASSLLLTSLERSPAPLDICKPQASLVKSEASAAYYWSNKNRDATCTGAAPYAAPFNLTKGPTWSWKDTTASIVSTHPCIDGEKNIYLSNRNGVVRKFDPSGALLWENRDGFGGQGAQVLVGGCVIQDGSLYVGFTAGYVMAVSMQSGRREWTVKASSSCGPDSWSLLAHNNMVLTIGRSPDFHPQPDFGGNNLLIALDARSGAKLWTFQSQNAIYNFIGSFVDGPPSVAFVDWSGVPHRVALCDGRLLWRNAQGREHGTMSTGGAIVEPATGRMFATGNVQEGHGTVTAYDVRDGTLLWQHDAPMPANNAPVVGNLHGPGEKASVVVAIGQNPGFPDEYAERTGFYRDGRPVGWTSKIYALDPATGSPTGWEFTPPVYRKPQAYGDRQPFHICLPDSWSNAAIGGDGTVYIGHMSGRIFTLRDTNGDGALSAEAGEVSEYFGGRCYQGSPGLAPGMLVATPCDGMHVFET